MLLSCTRHPANQQISCRSISGVFGYRKNAARGSDNSFLLKHTRRCQSSRLRNIQTFFSCTSIRRTSKSVVGPSPVFSAIGKTLRAVLTTASDPSVKKPADYATSRRFFRVLAIRRTNRSAVGPSPAFSAIGKTLRTVLTTASCPSFKKMSVQQTTQHPGVFFVYSPSGEPANPLSTHLRHFGYRKNATCCSDNSFRPFRQEDVRQADHAISRCFYRVLAIRRTSKSAVGSSPAFSAIGKTLRAVLTTASDPFVKKPADYATSRRFFRVLPSGESANPLSAHLRRFRLSEKHCVRFWQQLPTLPSRSQQTTQHPGVFFVYFHPANQQIRCRPISGIFGYRKNAARGSDNSFRPFRQEDVSPADYATSRRFFRVLAIRRISKSAVGPSPALSAIGKTLRAVLTTASDPSIKKTPVQQTTQYPGAFIVYSPSGEPANQLSTHLRCFRLSEKHCVRF